MQVLGMPNAISNFVYNSKLYPHNILEKGLGDGLVYSQILIQNVLQKSFSNEGKISVFSHCDIGRNISCNHLRTLVFDPLLVKIELELNCISSKNEKKTSNKNLMY